MNENWAMVIVGPLLIIFGLLMTSVSGPMPGAKPLYPPPLRTRLIWICFGAGMLVLGAVRLLQK